jgi:type I restriction enzyme M protein
MDQQERIQKVEKIAEEYLSTEIHPYVSDSWIDHSKTKIGYEIPFTPQFYSYSPPREENEIRAEIHELKSNIEKTLAKFQ